ncbi:hypothetical protein GV828_11010 [Flavobacterium sp. NST-5]|uniref:DUF4268 domain-containing protein n=1 Tax=Flavobacterium ichthyis TaxID=2698827 RepID=A0ABW9ZAY2_9FLAO|nr:hypothetical protein [Flavobacterium ichthyis]NBL65729.1 hypothetical protein [Flavobacterium ichthyis]
MKYVFKKYDWDDTIIFGVESEHTALNNIGSWGWTPQKIRKIIDGLEQSKTKPKGEEYLWGNEDVNLYANENGVLLIDVMAQRAGQHNPDEITLRLAHKEIIQFLQDFKKFVEKNS